MAFMILGVFFTGLLIGKSLAPSANLTEEKVIEDFSQRLNSRIEKGLFPFPEFLKPVEKIVQTSLDGKILTIDLGKRNLKVEVSNRFKEGNLFEYLKEPEYFVKTVEVDENTKILKLEMKSSEEIEKEGEEYKKRMESKDLEPIPPPVPYREIEISFRDLKEGQMVYVFSDVAFSLKDVAPIKAIKIIAQ